MHSLLVGIIILACAWLLKKLYTKDARVLDIPHPPLVPFFGNVFCVDPNNYSKSIEDYFEKTNEPIFTFWIFNTPIIFVADPKIAQDIIKDEVQFQREGSALDVFKFTMGNVLFTLDGPVWKKRRQHISYSFTPTKVKNLFPVVNAKAVQCADIAASLAKEKGFVEIDYLFTTLTMDLIFAFLLSKDCRIMYEDPHNIKQHFNMLRDEGYRLISIPGWKYVPAPSRIRFFLDRFRIDRFFREEISQRRALRESNPDLEITDITDALIEAQLTDDQIKSELIGLTFAGHEATAHAMAFTIHELSRSDNQRILQKVLDEIDSVIPDPKKPNETASLPDVDALTKLPYLTAVIKEVMRIYPIGVAHPTQVQNDVTVAGQTIPKGYEVLIHYYTMHRSEKFYKNARMFNPDRWLGEEDAADAQKGYMPFLHGPHKCIGIHLANMQMKTMIATLLKNYTFTHRPGFVFSVGSQITLMPTNGVELQMERRRFCHA